MDKTQEPSKWTKFSDLLPPVYIVVIARSEKEFFLCIHDSFSLKFVAVDGSIISITREKAVKRLGRWQSIDLCDPHYKGLFFTEWIDIPE